MESKKTNELETLLELSGTGYWRIDLIDGTVDASKVFWEMLGYKKGELEETLDNLKKIHYPADWEKGWEMIALVLKGEVPVYKNELRYLTKTKSWLWCEVKGIVTERDSDGNPLVFLGYSKDISFPHEMQEKMEKLKTLEQNYHKQLKKALADVKSLSGIIPICSSCKSIRNDEGYWKALEVFMEEHSEALFSHGLCNQCAEKLYKDEGWYQRYKESLKNKQSPEESD